MMKMGYNRCCTELYCVIEPCVMLVYCLIGYICILYNYKPTNLLWMIFTYIPVSIHGRIRGEGLGKNSAGRILPVEAFKVVPQVWYAVT